MSGGKKKIGLDAVLLSALCSFPAGFFPQHPIVVITTSYNSNNNEWKKKKNSMQICPAQCVMFFPNIPPLLLQCYIIVITMSGGGESA